MNSVSAILPFHDSEYVVEAIRSVGEQTRPPDELIAVSDAASSETVERVGDALADLDGIDCVLIERDVDSGDFPRPTNEAAAFADADIYAFLFHDDRWLPTYLERQVDALTETPPGVGLQWVGKYDIDARGERTGTSIVSWPRVSRRDIFMRCWVPTPSACVVRADRFHDIGGFDHDLQPLADWDFYLRMWQTCGLRSIDEPLMEFRNHDKQYEVTGWTKLNEYRIAFIEKHRELFERAGYYQQALRRHDRLCQLDSPPWA